jgi:hypothetical protein
MTCQRIDGSESSSHSMMLIRILYSLRGRPVRRASSCRGPVSADPAVRMRLASVGLRVRARQEISVPSWVSRRPSGKA